MAKGISIHIGLNTVDPDHYQGWSGPLNACEADAEDMAGLAESRGLATQRLITPRATRDNVIAALQGAADKLTGGDLLFLTYSGHGGQIPDNNDDEPDGNDETWCLFDGELIDDELHDLFAAFKPGVRIAVLSDSCHSGTVLRNGFMAAMRESGVLATMTAGEGTSLPAVRAMPASVALRVYRKHREFYSGLQARIPRDVVDRVRAHVLLLSGCQDNQTSSDGAFNGLFTANLLRVWNKGLFKGDYARFHKAIVDRMPPVQTPNFFRIGPPSPAFEKEAPFTL